MSVSLPNGSTISLASGYGSALPVSAATNANPCVMTSTAHGLSNGDYVEVTSGWSRLNGRILRVANVATNTIELEGYDSSSTSTHPAASGTGSVRKVSGWTQLSQILSSQTSGGDQNFTEYQFLESDIKVRIPTSKAPSGLDLQVADDSTLAGYVLANAANEDRLVRACKVLLASGAIILYSSYVSLNPTPSLTVDQVMAVQVTLSHVNSPIRYSS